MFPLEFDHRILEGLPLPERDDVTRVVQILKTVIVRRVIPYFKKNRGTDAITIAKVTDGLTIQRLEDEDQRVRLVSLLTCKDGKSTIHVHERIFDYFAFVIPSRPEAYLADGTPEEHKVLAFSELMLRHNCEHLFYPESAEREVIESDAVFAMERRLHDPTYYRDVRKVLSDELNGLIARPYLALFDDAEMGLPLESKVREIVSCYCPALADLPENLIEEVFLDLDTEIQTKVLGECYRKTLDTSLSLFLRTSLLRKLMALFSLVLGREEKQAAEVLEAFKSKWGLMFLLHELGIPERTAEGHDTTELLGIFKERLVRFQEDAKQLFPPGRYAAASPPLPEPKPVAPEVKSLKDRIDEARNNPRFPAQVIGVIEKNKLNAVGHSGSKYSELIETLLAVPWGKIRTIAVTPQEFEQGLDRTHYGLKKPKEIVCDFFTNLIWRYRTFDAEQVSSWRRTGSAFLFVGPPGVGKTSFAISIAENLGIPYHKLSLGGMRDEADLRGHGFTYEGSKPGAILQGLIKMGIMNGMFIMDEADKMEKFAVATLLEILDPEQNHLFHDKYTETTLDIDLSNCHFVLTANTLETVPATVVNRCEVVVLDRYSVEEKVAIALEHLIPRLRQRYEIGEKEIRFDPEEETELLKFLIRTYTHETGVRELERLIRTLFLRIFRKEILLKNEHAIIINREMIEDYIKTPTGPRTINEEDRIGEMMGLGVNLEIGAGALIPIQATLIPSRGKSESRPGYLSMVHATGNIQKIMDESRKVAFTAIFYCADRLQIHPEETQTPIHLHFMAASSPKDGPSAGGPIALALASALSGRAIRRDTAMTGEIDTQGRITGVGALDIKLETAYNAGCRTVIIPRENLYGEDGVERLSEALKREFQILTFEEWAGEHQPFDFERQVLQIVAVQDVIQAVEVAFVYEEEIQSAQEILLDHARSITTTLEVACKDTDPCFSILYVKDTKELELDGIQDSFWVDAGSILLAPPRVKKRILEKFPVHEIRARLWDFDPARDDLGSVLQNLDKEIQASHSLPVRMSMLAPFFFLIRQGVCLEGFEAKSSVGQLTLFANNFTAQGLKIKGSKPLLNRVFHYLSHLEAHDLAACPFLSRQNGIYVVDLSFIPEKYRLDKERAARILNAGLAKWLETVEGALPRNPIVR
jgi:endopeptidase La